VPQKPNWRKNEPSIHSQPNVAGGNGEIWRGGLEGDGGILAPGGENRTVLSEIRVAGLTPETTLGYRKQEVRNSSGTRVLYKAENAGVIILSTQN